MSSLHSFFKRIRSYFLMDPERDWIVLLIAAILFFVGIVVWNVFVFSTVANGGILGSSATTTAPVFSQSSLEALHSVFSNRNVEQGKYTTDVYHYADPSQ